MSDISAVKALVFDVFGTVVDWRSSLIADFTKWSETRGIKADWTAWSMAGARSMPPRWMRCASIRRTATSSSTRCTGSRWKSWSRSFDQGADRGRPALPHHGLASLHPWPDSVAGLTRLKTKYIIVAALERQRRAATNMAKFAGLPWTWYVGRTVRALQARSRNLSGAAKLLCLPPEQVMMVAAHNHDLKAAQKLGLKTAFVARPTEYGPLQKYDFEAKGDWDIVAKDFGGIADRMGC